MTTQDLLPVLEHVERLLMIIALLAVIGTVYKNSIHLGEIKKIVSNAVRDFNNSRSRTKGTETPPSFTTSSFSEVPILNLGLGARNHNDCDCVLNIEEVCTYQSNSYLSFLRKRNIIHIGIRTFVKYTLALKGYL